jgi:uncharacterized protein YecT (DUF1311 family)
MRRSITFILTIACMAFISPDTGRGGEASGDASKPKDCAEGGQQEMVACVAAEYRAADLELNKLYKQLKEQSSPEDQKSLLVAQRAWIKHRDAKCASEVGSSDDGSGSSQLLYSGAMNDCLTRGTLRRVEVLKAKLFKLGSK